MKKGLLTTTVLATLMFSAMASSVPAATIADYLAEKNIDAPISTTIDYYSKYVWRGRLLDDDNVSISAKANYSIPFGDLKASGNGNYDTEFYYGAGLAFVF